MELRINKTIFVERNALMDSQNLAESWMSQVSEFAMPFTEPGWRHFAVYLTGSLLAERRPLVTEMITALSMENHWRAAEWFLEKGKWPERWIEGKLAEIASPHCRWRGRNLWAVDDLKALKTGRNIYGTCPYHEYTSRSCNRAQTIWGHNWVLCGGLSVEEDSRRFLPACGRLYIRKDYMPSGETFRTKPQMAVEMLRLCAGRAGGRNLAIFDGGYAICSVVRPLLDPAEGQPRIDFLTRLRRDARIYHAPPAEQSPGRGRPRKWGERRPAPQDADQWEGRWHTTTAKIYGKKREVRYKKVTGQWHPAGPDARVNVFVLQVEGYDQDWCLVTSDLDLSAEEVVLLYAARFAQEDAHRDLKQEIGFGSEQGRLKNVVLRSLQLRLTEMTLLWILKKELDQTGEQWWPKPDWYGHKERGSLRDMRRLLRNCREDFLEFDWETLSSEKYRPHAAGASVPPARAA